MRDIKFRTWDGKDLKQVKYGLSLSFKKCNSMVCMDGVDCIDIMQFTGLQDKNGVDIYEGDIVNDGRQQNDHTSAGTQEVEFLSGAFAPFAIAGWGSVMDERKCEVIGNIHENPELLEIK